MPENYKKLILIVHCVDTEGPLYESVEAKFERLKDLFGIDNIPVTNENLDKLKKGELDIGNIKKDVINILNGHLANYNDTWDKIDNMLKRIMDVKFRNRLQDSYGGGWVYNWHCLDHVGYDYNPRRRDIGYHNIFDHYKSILEQNPKSHDQIHWHFHPMSTYRDAHRCATSYVNSSELYQILCRKVIERSWFPAVFRAGFQTERPDSNWFLEQWIPFDISNMALDDNSELDKTIDFRKGRSGDWRLAPSDWSVYHPSHDNYQLQGNCRRWIARALNVLNRVASIDQREMDKAFARSKAGIPTIVGLCSHDFRDIGTEVDHVRELISESVKKYPEVKYKFCEAVEAFRSAIWPKGIPDAPLELSLVYHPQSNDDVPFIEVNTEKGKIFGPQPFLAIETSSRRFIHDNFDFSTTLNKWYYAFHSDTLPIEDVARIGIAANDNYGKSCIKKIEFEGNYDNKIRVFSQTSG